ncbi:hypothetical protein PMIN03_003512 [Paraphaeosphaeria minitans]|uniref:2-amino-3-carboxymuconate-6-semialdehyde decarboxylase n=1 Tax=Paraphaeosphaeria minitans TaxID=565426 RepID=A0A9P6GN88_9PLEO|nr:2-amino-3-carboxymuconate-6-semialdehyde decarboxylase [Paraphaeosphaeria minitans]
MEPLVALEEHYFAASHLLPSHLNSLYSEQFKHVPALEDKLKSLDDLRIIDMQKAGVTFQIISHAPGISSLAASDCAKVNDYLAEKLMPRKNIFGGFAALPMGDPEAAATELRRVVETYGFLGALIDNHIPVPLEHMTGDLSQRSSALGATYYDSSNFHPVWKAAEELNVPIYIHPNFPTPAMQSHYEGLPSSASRSIATSGWGWHSECGAHLLRLYAGGVFDAFPKLRIIIGHFGEMLPFMLDRVNQLSNRWGSRARSFQTVYDENIVITTSGVWSVAPMHTIKASTRIENVLFSIDWPFAHAEWGKAFWDDLRKSGVLTKEELGKIGWRNAAKLFKLNEHDLLRGAQEFVA